MNQSGHLYSVMTRKGSYVLPYRNKRTLVELFVNRRDFDQVYDMKNCRWNHQKLDVDSAESQLLETQRDVVVDR